ncbi:MAG: thioredoxin-dependent thiol peroxidase [bacterium]
MENILSVDDKAPEFVLDDQQGHPHTLSSYRGHWVLVYFYPKDMTPGCTTEACAIRDTYPKFSQHDIIVLGISADSVESHAKFSEQHQLPFPILSDPKKKTLSAYGIWQKKTIFGKTLLGTKRMSFLINPDGIIAKVYEHVKPAEHAEEVLEDVAKQLQGSVA